MSLPELCINRPVFTIVLNLLIVLVGGLALTDIPIRYLPRVETPVVTVTTVFPGADVTLVERLVTTPLEDNIGGVEGSQFMTSTSSQGKSVISITFDLSIDPRAAASDVRQRVEQARDLLPDDARQPIVESANPDAQPILFLSFSSDSMSPVDITQYLKQRLETRFQSIPGVASVDIYGGRERVLHVHLDPKKLAANGVSPEDVETAILARNVEIPAGRIEGPNRDLEQPH